MSNLWIIPSTHTALTCILGEEWFAAVLEHHLNWSSGLHPSSPASPLPWGSRGLPWHPYEALEAGAIPGLWTRLVCSHFWEESERRNWDGSFQMCP